MMNEEPAALSPAAHGRLMKAATEAVRGGSPAPASYAEIERENRQIGRILLRAAVAALDGKALIVVGKRPQTPGSLAKVVGEIRGIADHIESGVWPPTCTDKAVEIPRNTDATNTTAEEGE